MAKLEIEQSDQAKVLFAQLAESDRTLVRKVLTIIDSAPLMPEQSLLVQLGVLEELLTAVKEGARISAVIGEPEVFAQRAIAEIGEDVRRDRHIGALMAVSPSAPSCCLALSAVSLVKGADRRRLVHADHHQPQPRPRALFHLRACRRAVFCHGRQKC